MPELLQPEIEREISKKKEKVIEEIEVPKSLLDNPYKYICNFYESIYPHIGRKVFSIVSLMPVSLIIPPILGKTKIKQKINLFLISPPGNGKTALAEEFEKFTFNPVFAEKITTPRLNWEIKESGEKISLITSDISLSLQNEDLVKFLEGILGDEGSSSYATMLNRKEELRKKRDAIAYLSGTHEMIANERIKDGFLFRCVPLIIIHSSKEHEDILDFVNDSIGNEGQDINRDPIIFFYQTLYKIQEGNHPEIDPIKGYIFPDEIKEDMKNFIKPLVKQGFSEFGITAVRQLHEAYRFMIAHAFLNIHNKVLNGKIKNGRIIIDEDDLKVSKYLIERTVDSMYIIMEAITDINRMGIKTYKQLKEWTDKKRMEEKKSERREKVFIMRGLVK